MTTAMAIFNVSAPLETPKKVWAEDGQCAKKNYR